MPHRKLAALALAASFACHPPDAAAPAVRLEPSVLEAIRVALTAAAEKAAFCHAKGDPTGRGSMRVVYSNDGSVRSAQILTKKFSETVTGGCVRILFRRATIQPFQGPVTIAIKSFEISERI